MSALEPDSPPDQRAFDEQANDPAFRAGVHRGCWRIERVTWPVVDISVAAVPREGAPDRFVLRCDLTNFPANAPSATLWDPDTDAMLPIERRPKGEDAGVVFRVDWEGGRALYAPYDRVGLSTHQNWATDYPRTAWTPTRTLTWWVNRIFELLNDDDYTGI